MADLHSIDGYDEAAAAKLWARLPAAHRAADSEALDEVGPLQELLQRLGTQVAVVRRNLDRLWEDQSIESCDDWVIPYLAALVGTNLVPAMHARAQRLDVANTISYRRRKGTLSLVEQLAADVTGWECRAVEMFRRLARRRHLLDPPIGRPADAPDPDAARRLQRAQQLTGLLTATPAGGFADLRSAAGAAEATGPFDELSHRVDVRRGEGALGWYGIPKLALFLWPLVSLPVDRATPVAVAGCDGHFTFDPTGRQVALWQAADRPPEALGERWRPLAAWQVPGPLTAPLLAAVRAADETPPPLGAFPDPGASLWPRSHAVRPLGAAVALDEDTVRVWPEVGRFAVPPGTGAVEAGHHHGRGSRIGAGGYDRRRVGVPEPPDPEPVVAVPGGSVPDHLATALAALGAAGTVVVRDGLTCVAVADVGPVDDVAIRADDHRQAVVRLVRGDGPWVFEGDPDDADTTGRLRLEGLLVSGEDIVLRGGFDRVVVSCCTLDPGTSGDVLDPPDVWGRSVDGRDLQATRLWIEGTVRCLVVDRSITGPIRTRLGGHVGELCVNDSVVQGLPSGAGGLLGPEEVHDPDALARLLRDTPDALTAHLAAALDATASAAVTGHEDGDALAPGDLQALVDDLNAVLLGGPLWDAVRFEARDVSAEAIAAAEAGPAGDALVEVNRRLLAEALALELGDAALALGGGRATLERTTVLGAAHVRRIHCSESRLGALALAPGLHDRCVRVSAEAIAAAEAGPAGDALVEVNRRLLAEALALELGDAALALGGGRVTLERTTVLGAAHVRRIHCSESILGDVAIAEDVQDGCVRFSAWPTGSALPRKYESVRVAPRAPLFVSRRFGEAGYAVLDAGADAAILGGSPAGTPSIRAGSRGGSEMGAFCRDGAAVKERSLHIKLREHLPVGLTPVLVPMPPPDPEAETTRGRPWPPT